MDIFWTQNFVDDNMYLDILMSEKDENLFTTKLKILHFGRLLCDQI